MDHFDEKSIFEIEKFYNDNNQDETIGLNLLLCGFGKCIELGTLYLFFSDYNFINEFDLFLNLLKSFKSTVGPFDIISSYQLCINEKPMMPFNELVALLKTNITLNICRNINAKYHYKIANTLLLINKNININTLLMEYKNTFKYKFTFKKIKTDESIFTQVNIPKDVIWFAAKFNFSTKTSDVFFKKFSNVNIPFNNYPGVNIGFVYNNLLYWVKCDSPEYLGDWEKTKNLYGVNSVFLTTFNCKCNVYYFVNGDSTIYIK